MSEEQNNQEEELSVIGSPLSNTGDRPLETSEPSALNLQSLKEMEAHHLHHVTHKKKWTEFNNFIFLYFSSSFPYSLNSRFYYSLVEATFINL
ncbi:MAG: hypothetical protein WKF59_25560 [Chitinophagaceae bacterium]